MRLRSFLIMSAFAAVFAVAVCVFALGMTQDLVASTEGFFELLGGGDYEGAYACLSVEFHGNTTVDELRAFAQESALANYSDATWWERRMTGDQGFLDGEVETTDGRCVPVTVLLLKEHDRWRIYQIDWSVGEPAESGSQPRNGDPGV